MDNKNKMVIKINYQGDKLKRSENTVPEVITEWNVKRILLALCFLAFFLVILLYFLFSGTRSESAETLTSKVDVVKKILPEKIEIKTDKMTEPVVDSAKATVQEVPRQVIEVVKQDAKPKLPTTDEIAVPVQDVLKAKLLPAPVQKTEAVLSLSHPNISRALLAKAVQSKEPVNPMGAIVKVEKNKATAIYYFTEIMDMKGQQLLHQWYWKDTLIFERKINILGNRWRASTSKLIQSSRSGNWKARIINPLGEVLNEIKFTVEADE